MATLTIKRERSSAMFGLFNDEGLVEGDFLTVEDAARALRTRYSSEDELRIVAQCEEHPDQERPTCELCNEDED